MTIVAAVLVVGLMVGLICINAYQAFSDARWLRFRRNVRDALHPKADPLVIARLEHELGVSGHRADNCLQCDPTVRMPTRFSKGGVVVGPTKPMRLVSERSPDGTGSLSVIYADECFLSSDGICVRRDDLHQKVNVKPDRWWICPLHD